MKHTAVSVGNTSTAVLSHDDYRRYVLLQNDSDAVLYLKFDGAAAVMNEGFRLGIGEKIEFSGLLNNAVAPTLEIRAISAVGSKNLLVTTHKG